MIYMNETMLSIVRLMEEDGYLIYKREKEMNKQLFFHGQEGVARTLFNGRMTSKQVKGCERIIDIFDDIRPSGTLEQLAYILSTSFHETARKMQPVRETLATSDEAAISRLDRAWDKGQLTWVSKPYWRDGYFGRGDVQLTHRYNYEGKLRDVILEKYDVDIGKNPELALEPLISGYIMIEGMTIGDTNEPDFTRYALEDYVNINKVDYHGARKSVNPGDKPSYELLASYAKRFESALIESGYKQ